ncbi:MAG: Clp1/GlmU family protein [Syntrophorhabdaceae bacterium]
MEIEDDRQRQDLVEHLLKEKGTTLFLGTVNSGKSILTRYIVEEILSAGEKVCLVDSDVGQSSLGLPGTVSMKYFSRLSDMADYAPQHFYFVGAANPALMPHPVIRGTKLMVDRCRTKKSLVLVDTGGLVTGSVGRFLKIQKITAVKPDHIVAIEWKAELEPILEESEGACVHLLAPSQAVKLRGPRERENYRYRKFRTYFEQRRLNHHHFQITQMRYFYNGKPFLPNNKDLGSGLVVGLNRKERTLALGVITGWNEATLNVVTPLMNPETVDRIIMGNIIFPGLNVATLNWGDPIYI